MKTSSWTRQLQDRRFSLAEELTLGVIASIIIALCAKLRIYLPISPIPFVMQGSLLLFLAIGLGRRGAIAMSAAFLLQGLAGLPVFASGKMGVTAFVGPTGGYLIGYAVASYLVGAIAERQIDLTSLKVFVAMTIGSFVIYFFGVLYLSWLFSSLSKAIMVGMLPFIITDIMKNVFLTTFYSMISKRLS